MQSDPDAGEFKTYGHLIFTAVGIIGSGLFVARGTFGGQDIVGAGMVAAGIAGFAAVAHLMLTFCEPIMLTRRHGLALLLAIGAPIAFLIPWFLQPAEGWPLNAETGPRDAKTHSRVIAPGDVATIYWYPQEIKSVNGRWRGTPKAKVTNAVELACSETLPTTGGRDENWGIILTNGVSAHVPCIRPKLHIPNDERLAGNSLKVRITLPIEYPSPVGREEFDVKNATVVRDETILLASPEVKQAYSLTWIFGGTIGMSGTILGGLMMAWLSLGLSHATSVAAPQPPIEQVQPLRTAVRQRATTGTDDTFKVGIAVLVAIVGLPLMLNWCFDQKNIALKNAVERLGGTAYRAVAEHPANKPIASDHTIFTSSFHPVLFLDLSSCNLTDDDLNQVCQLATPSLRHLKLDNNRRITNASIQRLNKLITLETISVTNTSMTESGVRRLMIHPGYYPGGASHRTVCHSFD